MAARAEIASIVVGERLRALDMAAVETLAESIDAIGLRTPITLRRDGDSLMLVAGAHRLEAARRLGWEYVDADIVENWTALEARRWEIAENLHRADLTALQRDEQIAEWVRVTDEIQSAQLAPIESKREDGRGHRAESGINRAAREIGVERTSAQRAIKVAGLTAEAKKAAREEGLDNNRSALLAASRAAPDEQAGVLRNWRSESRVVPLAGRSKIDADVKERAAREVAEIMAEYIPGDAWDGLKANLFAAGASAIAVALTNLTGQAVMDRRFGARQ